MMLHLAVILMCLWLTNSAASVEAAESALYKVAIQLGDIGPGQSTDLRFSFKANSDDYRKLDRVEVDLPTGSAIAIDTLTEFCILTGQGSDSGEICAAKYPRSQIASGRMVTSVFGRRVLLGDVYLADSTSTPRGDNLVYYFPAGQIFGLGAQTLLGNLSLVDPQRQRMQLREIQEQLDLPWGMSAEMIGGEFAFSGQSGRPPFRNPLEGTTKEWRFRARLGWKGGLERSVVRATKLE